MPFGGRAGFVSLTSKSAKPPAFRMRSLAVSAASPVTRGIVNVRVVSVRVKPANGSAGTSVPAPPWPPPVPPPAPPPGFPPPGSGSSAPSGNVNPSDIRSGTKPSCESGMPMFQASLPVIRPSPSKSQVSLPPQSTGLARSGSGLPASGR